MKTPNIIPFIFLCGYCVLFVIMDSTIGILIFFYTCWFFIPCAIWALYAFIKALSKKRVSREYRRTIITSQAVVIVMFAICFAIDKFYNLSNVDDIRRNFDKHEKEQREHYLNEFQWALDKNTNTAGTKTKKGRPSESTSQKIIQQHRLT